MTLVETIKDTQVQTRPPEKLSDLIRLAVKDARRLNPDEYWPNADLYHKRCHIDTDLWAQEIYGPLPPPNACHVCVAGAVIAGTLKMSPDEPWRPVDFENAWSGSLSALDSIRQGLYHRAYCEHYYGDDPWPPMSMELSTKLKTLARNYPPVHRGFQNWEEFKAHIDSLEAIADIFEQKGL